MSSTLALIVISMCFTTSWTADTSPSASAPSTQKPHPQCVWTWMCRSPCKPVLRGGRCVTKCRNVVLQKKCVKACDNERSSSNTLEAAVAATSANGKSAQQSDRCVTRCTTDHVRRCSRVCPAPSTLFKCRVACKHRCVRPRKTALTAHLHK